MRSMALKRLAVLSAVFVCAGAVTLAGTDGEIVLERTFDSRAGATLEFDSDSGGISILGEDRDTIQITVRAKGIDPEEAREVLDVRFEESPDGITVRARFKAKRGGWFSGMFDDSDGNVHYEVLVPRATHLSIDNGSGGLEAREIDGDVSIDNGSGGVRLDEIVGDVSIDNGSGGIRVDRVEGDVSIDNGSGGVKVSEIVGDISIDNGSGGIRLDDVDGALEVETSSGGVSATMVGRNQGIHAETSSGGVQIRVPAGWGADVDMRSGSGEVIIDGWAEIDLVDAERFRGAVGGGGPTIHMESSSGDVELIAD